MYLGQMRLLGESCLSLISRVHVNSSRRRDRYFRHRVRAIRGSPSVDTVEYVITTFAGNHFLTADTRGTMKYLDSYMIYLPTVIDAPAPSLTIYREKRKTPSVLYVRLL